MDKLCVMLFCGVAMKTIYRHKTGFADGTDRIEVEDGVITLITQAGKRESMPGVWSSLAEQNVEHGSWVKEIVED